ncbi:MAG: hypothetical protein A2W25_02685 [candidate division Zixibacteria bacterium RBG_16_53_22]|nr:MAG: hypothetical protein A2W25_02685 [candidate division Zixibacteria bacterium RBG_16_53_22]
MGSYSKSLVVKIKSDAVIKPDGEIDQDIIADMVEAGFSALSPELDAIASARELLGNPDSIGMKVNTIGGPGMSTRVGLVNALAGFLKSAGYPLKRQIIWDRHDEELANVGFSVRSRGDGPYCFGTDHIGVGYSQALVSNGQIGGLLSRLLVDYSEVVINVPVLKDHGVAGITGALKNHYGSIHNPNKYHGANCNPYIADLNALEQIKSRQRLIVMDALRVQFHGGPAYQKRWAADCGMVLFGTDPVAIDTIGYDIIEGLRSRAGLESIKGSRRQPIYLNTAADYGLGINDVTAIKIEEITV